MIKNIFLKSEKVSEKLKKYWENPEGIIYTVKKRRQYLSKMPKNVFDIEV